MKKLITEVYQPPSPKNYKIPTVVQPVWRPLDLMTLKYKDAKENLATELCKQYGVSHCLLLDRARSGLNLLINTYGLRGEWITTSMMHRPTGVLLKQQCKNLALADVDDDFTILPDSVNRLISPQSDAILATHLYGKTANLKSLRNIADQHNIALIENAVHMPGGFDSYGKRIGSWGDATVLSFNVDKPLGGLLGGALLTNRDDIWQAVQSYKLESPGLAELQNRVLTTYLAYRLKPLILKTSLGKKYRKAKDGVVEIEQFSIDHYKKYSCGNIHPIQALAALKSLGRIDQTLTVRQRNAELLTKQLQKNVLLDLPSSDEQRPHAYTYYPIVLKKESRFELGRILSDLGIETKWRYYPLHLQSDFVSLRRDPNLNNTERLWRNHLLVPAGASSSKEHIMYLANAINNTTSQL